MTRVGVAINDPRLADHIAGLAAESEELQIVSTLRDPQDLRGGLPRHDLDVVLVHDRRGAVPLIEVTREVAVAQPDLALVLIVPEISPELLRSGMQAGARDVIAEPIGLEQLEASVLAANAWTQALRIRAARDAGGELLGVGRVVTVVGAKGGVGTTTVAVHLALAARALGEASVCLVEYDLQAGDLRAFLDLPYRRSVVDLASVADELTGRHLHESLYTHPSGMRVLLGPQEGEQAESVSGAAARNILTAIRTREDLTIVDAGSTLSEASAIAAEMADTAVIVSTPDVVSLRGVSRLTALWARLKVEPPEIVVLLNRTSRKLEVQPDLARRVVQVPVLETTVPASFFALESAVNTGIPARDSASEAMLRPMASVLGEISALAGAGRGSAKREPDRAHSIAARFAGESGQATVEFTGVLPIALVTILIVWQIVLVGMTYVFAGHAARAGARALAVGSPVAAAAKSDLPSSWESGTTVSDTTDNQGNGTVHVSVQVPLLVPGLITMPVPIDSSARTVIEDMPLNGEQQTFSLLGGFGTVGGVPPLVPPLPSPGDTATIGPDGNATAPLSAPAAVKQMIAAANAIDKFQYCYGGGHDAQFAPSTGTSQGAGSNQVCTPPSVGYDCSGSVSFVLHEAGLLSGYPLDSTGFESYGDPGPGRWVTIYANGDHVHIVIAGLDFDTALPNAPGPIWGYGSGQTAGFVVRHPPGL